MTDILDTIDDLDGGDDILDLLEVDSDDEDSLILDLTDYEMSETEAIEITEAIKSAATATYVLISRAHAQKAHIALGYKTWAEYIEEEFDMSASRSYQLLNMSKVVEEIEGATPEGTEIQLTEAQARDIKRELPKITERIREETKDSSPEEAAEAVKRVVDEARYDNKEEEKAKKAREQELEDARTEARQEALEDVADQMLAVDKPNAISETADGDVIEVEVEGENEGLTLMEVANLQNFIHSLDAIAVLPPADEFIETIPDSRKEDVSERLLVATSYLNRLQTMTEMWELDD